ncbi:hypothetical protein BH18VER2_BH18VER2_14620 [soil metagenome]
MNANLLKEPDLLAHEKVALAIAVEVGRACCQPASVFARQFLGAADGGGLESVDALTLYRA